MAFNNGVNDVLEAAQAVNVFQRGYNFPTVANDADVMSEATFTVANGFTQVFGLDRQLGGTLIAQCKGL